MEDWERLVSLRAALAPFKRAADVFDKNYQKIDAAPGSVILWGHLNMSTGRMEGQITLDDVRSARAVLKETETP